MLGVVLVLMLPLGVAALAREQELTVPTDHSPNADFRSQNAHA
jgi:hypothetical protein